LDASARTIGNGHARVLVPGARDHEEIHVINGIHTILYSSDAEADRAFLRDVLGLGHVDAGDGWLIFGLPPAEIAVHPDETSGRQQFLLMCDDVAAFVAGMAEHGVVCDPVTDQGWGRLTGFTLPGGGQLEVYEPRHERPEPMEGPA
jgi:catechol 2,3-dioxygenase-like lactoylglutathione lyase family enzyme